MVLCNIVELTEKERIQPRLRMYYAKRVGRNCNLARVFCNQERSLADSASGGFFWVRLAIAWFAVEAGRAPLRI